MIWNDELEFLVVVYSKKNITVLWDAERMLKIERILIIF
jgi:hypothetical protein